MVFQRKREIQFREDERQDRLLKPPIFQQKWRTRLYLPNLSCSNVQLMIPCRVGLFEGSNFWKLQSFTTLLNLGSQPPSAVSCLCLLGIRCVIISMYYHYATSLKFLRTTINQPNRTHSTCIYSVVKGSLDNFSKHFITHVPSFQRCGLHI